MEHLNFTLVIPSLDPDDRLPATIHAAIDAGVDDILLVDDGSSPENRHYFEELSALPQVTLLTHPVNQGKGAALKTAFSYFLENRTDRIGVVTADGDGQHRTKDILACAREMENDPPAVILGCRDFSREEVPWRSRFGNRCTSLVFKLFFSMNLSDTQTGLRAIPKEFLPELLRTKGTRFEYETNMLILLGEKKIPFREIKIETIYFDDNRASHFRPVQDSLRVYSLILKYTASGLCSSVIDLVLFFLLGAMVFRSDSSLDVFLTTICSRFISSLTNFIINRNVVFASKKKILPTIARFSCLAVPVALTSWASVYLLSHVLGIRNAFLRTLIKMPVDFVLFLIGFRVQRKWVFAEKS